MIHEYSRARDLAIRIAALYFGLHALAIPFDSGNAPRKLYGATWGKLNAWFAQTVFGVTEIRGAPMDAISQHVLVLLVATIGGILWVSVDGRPTVSDTVHRIMRVGLRYYVGVITMIYGAAKVIPLQFPRPSLDLMIRPYGELTPMSLLWSFMGYSPAYTIFTGLGEWVGAFLLFFRRTTTLGALILAAVFANVVLLNYAYGVIVKTLSTNLLLACLVLIAPDIVRLVKVFVLNQSVGPSQLAEPTRNLRLARFRKFAKPLIVTLASVGPLVFAAVVYSTSRVRSPLYGVYESTQPAIASTEWQMLVFDRPGAMSIVTGADELRRYRAAVDTAADTVRYWARSDKSDAETFRLNRLDSATIVVVRDLQGAGTSQTFRKKPLTHFPLLRPFSWR
jgi:hypothetical protein